MNSGPFSKKLWIVGNPEVLSKALSLMPPQGSESRSSGHGPWKDRAANDYTAPFRAVPEHRSNLFADPPDVAVVKVTIRLTRRSYTNKNKIRVQHRVSGIHRSAEPIVGDCPIDNAPDSVFNNWGKAAPD